MVIVWQSEKRIYDTKKCTDAGSKVLGVVFALTEIAFLTSV